MRMKLEGSVMPLSDQVENAKARMIEKGYAQRTIKNYLDVWRHLIDYAEAEGVSSCTDDLIINFAKFRYGITDVFHPGTNKEKLYARMLLCLRDITVTDIWVTHRSYRLPNQFKSLSLTEAFDEYTNWLIETGLKPGSILLKQQILRDFLAFSETEKICDICELTVTTISRYLEVRNELSTATKSNIIVTLRGFFRTPKVAVKLPRDLSINLKVPNTGRYERLPSNYSKDEIRSILSCIDRSEPEGKKDYAVILLAIDTGMRISDIINLKLADINWTTESIEIVQKKTEAFLSITISEALKWALLDYLMNARPKHVRFDNLFLRSVAPFDPYISAGNYYNRLNKYFKTAGVKTEGKHHGMHVMRHNLATRLMHDDVSIAVVSEALGHRYANVTKQYIRVNIDKLRLAALEVSSNG